jgi:hypothetical protein
LPVDPNYERRLRDVSADLLNIQLIGAGEVTGATSAARDRAARRAIARARCIPDRRFLAAL